MGFEMNIVRTQQGTIDRRQFVKELIAACPDALIISGLGSPSYDVFAAGDELLFVASAAAEAQIKDCFIQI
jgi:hypothetical protein